MISLGSLKETRIVAGFALVQNVFWFQLNERLLRPIRRGLKDAACMSPLILICAKRCAKDWNPF